MKLRLLAYSLLALLGVLALQDLAYLGHAYMQLGSTFHPHAGLEVMTAGPAMEILSGYVTQPNTALTAWTMASGDSLQIRNSPDASKEISLLTMWADNQVAGYMGVRSPRFHDNTKGYRARATVSDVVPLFPLGVKQRLYGQDVLIVEHSGSNTAGDLESGSLLMYYEDLPGSSARFITPDELRKRWVHCRPVENTLALGTAGGYSGAEAINAEEDPLIANTDYALVGYLVDTECCTVTWKGIDTGNLRVGGPGNETLRHVTANWFIRLSDAFGKPLIPVFNSANKAGITLEGVQDENGADPLVNSILVQLSPSR